MKIPSRVSGVLLWSAVAVVLFGPVWVGAFNVFPAAPVAGLLLILCLYAFSHLNDSLLPKRLSVVALSVCLAVTTLDLFARAYRYYVYDDTPKELYLYQWPPLPQLLRYMPNGRFEGENYGNLSRMSGRSEWREYRKTLFVTDQYGFRNEPAREGQGSAPDLIVLGDSFGEARDTRQDETLGAVLAAAQGRKVYNLSVGGASPWQEYANLLVEADRLGAKEGAVVLWLFFSGNDLDEQYLPYFDKSQLPWRRGYKQWVDSVRRFWNRSYVRAVVERRRPPGPEQVIERKFIDGRRLLFMQQYARNKDLTAEEVRRHPNFGALKATVEAMKRLADEKRLKVTVALVPSKEEVYSWVLDGGAPWSTGVEPSPFSAALEEMARNNGMPYLDLKPTLVGASKRAFEESGQLLWWGDDTHWNPLAQKVAAEAIQRGLLPPPGGAEPRGAPDSK